MQHEETAWKAIVGWIVVAVFAIEVAILLFTLTGV
jgi:hypothetical protein